MAAEIMIYDERKDFWGTKSWPTVTTLLVPQSPWYPSRLSSYSKGDAYRATTRCWSMEANRGPQSMIQNWSLWWFVGCSNLEEHPQSTHMFLLLLAYESVTLCFFGSHYSSCFQRLHWMPWWKKLKSPDGCWTYASGKFSSGIYL